MDKQRLVNTRKAQREIHHGSDTGNAAVDGYTVIERDGINDHKSRYKKADATPEGLACDRGMYSIGLFFDD